MNNNVSSTVYNRVLLVLSAEHFSTNLPDTNLYSVQIYLYTSIIYPLYLQYTMANSWSSNDSRTEYHAIPELILWHVSELFLLWQNFQKDPVSIFPQISVIYCEKNTIFTMLENLSTICRFVCRCGWLAKLYLYFFVHRYICKVFRLVV